MVNSIHHSSFIIHPYFLCTTLNLFIGGATNMPLKKTPIRLFLKKLMVNLDRFITRRGVFPPPPPLRPHAPARSADAILRAPLHPPRPVAHHAHEWRAARRLPLRRPARPPAPHLLRGAVSVIAAYAERRPVLFFEPRISRMTRIFFKGAIREIREIRAIRGQKTPASRSVALTPAAPRARRRAWRSR